MPFCSNCGKPADPGPLCDDCAKAAAPAPSAPEAPASPAAAAPTAAEAPAAAPAAPRTSFAKDFLSDPAAALRDVWVDRKLRYAWLALLWIVLAMFLSSFLADLTAMFRDNQGIQAILPALARGALAPVPTLLAFFVAVPVFAAVARKGPSGRPSSSGRALAAYGAASIPYAVALTVYIPVAVALQLLNPIGTAAMVLNYYGYVVAEPLRYAAVLLALFACRAVSESPRDGRTAGAGVLVLILQAVVQAVAGWFAGLLALPLG